MQGGGVTKRAWHVDPGPDSTDTYMAQITNPSTGEWSFYFNDEVTPWARGDLEAWINKKGEEVMWQGEILRKSTDMPGTDATECIFDYCMYKRKVDAQENWYNAGLTDANMDSDDDDHWKWNRISGRKFEIWDVYPIP